MNGKETSFVADDSHDPEDVKKFEVSIWGRYTPNLQLHTYKCIAESEEEAVQEVIKTLQDDDREFGLDPEDDGPLAGLQISILEENPGKDFSFKFVMSKDGEVVLKESHDNVGQIAIEHGISPALIAEMAQTLDLSKIRFMWRGYSCSVLYLDASNPVS